MVIRRAAELQAGSADDAGGEGLSEEDALRIGKELGLTGPHLVRALAEVRSGAADEPGWVAKVMGSARFAASRAVSGDASQLARDLEAYLLEREFLVVQRRLADRTVFVRASGVLAAVGRTTTGLFRRAPLLAVENLDVSVRQLEPGLSYVGLSTDMTGERTGHLAGGAAMGGMFGGAGAATLGLVVAPVAAVVGVPIFAAAVGAMRFAYQDAAGKVVIQLEALLDRLEHGDLRIG
jgi:hypothetical protein